MRHCFWWSSTRSTRRKTFAFPPTGFTLQWWRDAWNSEGMWTSLGNSVVVGLGATAIALVLGTMAAFAVQRYDFFGRRPSVSLWCCRSRCPASSPVSR